MSSNILKKSGDVHIHKKGIINLFEKKLTNYYEKLFSGGFRLVSTNSFLSVTDKYFEWGIIDIDSFNAFEMLVYRKLSVTLNNRF